ncbi:MAG: ATP-binding cassette domain-containing protein, partial [Jannaschia sp.]
MLDVRGLAKSYGSVRALRHADLTVAAGEAVAVMGANGAGKSTLMNVLGGLTAPDAGTIVLDRQAIRPDGPAGARAAGIAFVQQELSVFPTMSVAENVFAGDYPTRAGR